MPTEKAKIFRPAEESPSTSNYSAIAVFVAAFLSTCFFAFLPPMMHWRQSIPVWPVGIRDQFTDPLVPEPLTIFAISAVLCGLSSGGIALLSWRKYNNDRFHSHWESGLVLFAAVSARTVLFSVLNVFFYFPLSWSSGGMRFPPELSYSTFYIFLTLTLPASTSTTLLLLASRKR